MMIGKRKNKTMREYSYGEFMVLFPCCRDKHRHELVEQLLESPCPDKICGVKVPTDLNAISYGLIDDLKCDIEAEDPALAVAKTLLKLDEKKIFSANVVEIFGFMNFVRKELERINAMFASIKVQYSKEELNAGVKDLDFGSFGVLDWYARRMGITNQNEVRDVAWVRIFICMKNDAEQNNYERRLHKQYDKKR